MNNPLDAFAELQHDIVGLKWLLQHRSENLRFLGNSAITIGNELDQYFGGNPESEEVMETLCKLPPNTVIRSPASWETTLQQAWQGKVGRLKRLEWSGQIKSNAEIIRRSQAKVTPLDQNNCRLLKETGLDYLIAPYRNTDDFLDKSFGFAVVEQGKIVSVGTAYYIADKKADLAVATYPSMRGRGLATSVLVCLADKCCSRGLEPQLHAAACNKVAARLAGKVGFTTPEEFTAYARML